MTPLLAGLFLVVFVACQFGLVWMYTRRQTTADPVIPIDIQAEVDEQMALMEDSTLHLGPPLGMDGTGI